MTHAEDHAQLIAEQAAAFVNQLRQELAGTKLGVEIRGAESRQLVPSQKAAGSPAVAQRVSMSPGRLMGWALRETTGTGPATFYLRDGQDAGGDMLAPVQLLAAESVREYFEFGLSFVNGLFFDLVSGGVEGTLFINGSAD